MLLPFVGKLESSKPYKTGSAVYLMTTSKRYLLEFLVLVPDIVREVVNTQSWVRIEGEAVNDSSSYVQKLHVLTIERAL